MNRLYLVLFFLTYTLNLFATEIITGANQPEKYLKILKNKHIGLVVNHTSVAQNVHLVDFLLDKKITINKIFAPEHGFRGNMSAGEKINDEIDPKTGIQVVSLYGKKQKPTKTDLEGIDLLVFDIQDVGCRFYTYISTLHYVIEACAENNVPLLVLDRPNPNGDYTDGPVLEKKFQSFVGMDPIPVVHGCTVGEMALMINGENWHSQTTKCNITIIPVKNYTHKSRYQIPVKPSPNLPNSLSVRLYPSLCFFEATSVSIGRGTAFPFQVIGGLNPALGPFTFTPVSIPGVADNPLNMNKVCYGIDLRALETIPTFTLQYFIDFYSAFENKQDFLVNERWFNLLAGNNKLISQIKAGIPMNEIRKTWQADLENYKTIRKKYLLYTDFE